jgi:5-formyltetrahydrofolate cyclo-ligase
MEDSKQQKNELRKQILKQRNSLSLEEVSTMETNFTQSFLNNEELINIIQNLKQPIAIYYPSKNELSSITLAKHLAKKYNTKFCLPIVSEKNTELKFVSWNLQENELQQSKIYKNILEPNISKINELQLQCIVPETLIIPLVAFDKNCNRLGMGGGFYDQTITNLRKQNQKLTTIGIAYEMQKLEQIPTEKNDEILDFVVTENSIYRKK